MTEETKTCITCGKTLPLTLEYFNRSKLDKDGFKGECKKCIRIRNTEYRKKVIKGSEEDKREYYTRNDVLDERKIKCVELHSKGLGCTEIAKTVGISRNTYYEWMKMESVKAEARRLEQDLISSTRAALIGYGSKAVEMLKTLAETSDSEKVRLDASKTLLDKVISNAVKISVDDDRDSDEITVDMLDNIIEMERVEILDVEY